MLRHYYWLSFKHQYSTQQLVSLNPVKDDSFPLAPAAQVFHMTLAAEAWRGKKKSLLLQELAIPFSYLFG